MNDDLDFGLRLLQLGFAAAPSLISIVKTAMSGEPSSDRYVLKVRDILAEKSFSEQALERVADTAREGVKP